MELQQTDSVQSVIGFFENSPIPFSCYDENLCLVSLNDAALKLINRDSREDSIGKSLEEISPGIGATGRLDLYAGVAKTGVPIHLRSVVTVPLLGNKEIGTYAFKVGNGVGIVAIDVSEWLREERAMITQLEQKNKELEQFAYVASHDLQEPLETVSSFVGVLQKKYAGKLDEKGDTYIGFIVQAAKRMQTLVRNVLEYSRIGKSNVKEPVDCNKLIREVITDLDASIQASQATVTAHELPVVNGNSIELKQLFQNLISNAIKFRKADVAPVVEISAAKEDGSWKFAVSDNGIGIDEKFYDRIFVIFQRLHNRSQYEGTGIGLSLGRKIVESHGGKIWVTSKPGEGSTFYFTIQS